LNFLKQCLLAITAMTVGQISAKATLVSVTAPGDLLALLPASDLASSSSNTSFGAGLSQINDNFVNTANQDNGLIFADSDTDQRVAITGFNSQILDIRFFTSPSDPGRFPSSLTIYYSVNSTTSLTSSNYTGLLLASTVLSGAAFTPVAGSTAAYIDFSVNAPLGTQSLLFDIGNANGEGDRISEVQAFTTPEPPSLCLIAASFLVFAKRRFSKGHR
jgi:hypothetical protein